MKISFLLLLATGRDIYLATSILLPSIRSYFKMRNLKEIVIIIKDKDHELLLLRLNELKQNNVDLPIKILKESEIYPKSSEVKNTYYLQMYLKILCGKIIKTDHYLTLDADIIFLNKTDINVLFNENKIFYQKFKKDKWLKRSSDLLNLEKMPKYSVNQTPFIFKTELIKKMLNDIDVEKLILENQCSEYTLYHIYLLKNNIFYENYEERKFLKFAFKYPHNHLLNTQIQKLFKILKHKKLKYTIIQSRLNIHKHLTNEIKENIPLSYYSKSKIGLLTVVSGELYNKRYKNAFEIKKKYCEYHNYDFIFEIVDENKYKMKNGWIKIFKLLETLKHYDYIFCSDADVIITNRDIRIEDLIFKYMNENHIGLITTDYISINNGNTIWKNTPKTYQLLTEMIKIGNKSVRYSLNKPFKAKGIYEQPNLIHLYNQFDDIRKSLKIIPQFEMNSYTKMFPELRKKNCVETIGKIYNRCNWTRGDFLVHFAGMNYINNNKFKINIENIIEKFIKIYYENISKKEGKDFKGIK